MRNWPQPEERFKGNYRINEQTGCWEWTGYKCGKYGGFKLGSKQIKAHRYSYILANGEIPNGLHVLHKCDNRICVNPDHLFLGTNHDNIKDCIKKGRRADLRGENNGKTTLTEIDVRAIRRKYKEGRTQQSLADEYGLAGQVSVSAIVTRRTWKHVE